MSVIPIPRQKIAAGLKQGWHECKLGAFHAPTKEILLHSIRGGRLTKVLSDGIRTSAPNIRFAEPYI